MFPPLSTPVHYPCGMFIGNPKCATSCINVGMWSSPVSPKEALLWSPCVKHHDAYNNISICAFTLYWSTICDVTELSIGALTVYGLTSELFTR